MDYNVIKSRRQTVSIQVTKDGVTVRAPYMMTNKEIEQFVSEHEAWIEKHIKQLREQLAAEAELEKLTADEIRELAERALEYIPARAAYYASLIGVTYGKITIRNQKSRWGSCSANGNLNFNCLLMLAPPEVIDSVVVHELCHRKQMNHSQAFYDEVLRVYPDYHKWNRWLKENGSMIIKRMG